MSFQHGDTNKAAKCGRVVIFGGGVAGALLAKQLSRKANVTLVDPLDYFEVPMAVPRNLVKPGFTERSILPFATALPEVEHINAKLVELRSDGGLVEDRDGVRTLVCSDISILATGSHFANPLMRAVAGSDLDRKAFYERFNARLLQARRVLIIGGGPIGVEVAGEISENWPDKSVTILEAAPRILSGTAEHAAAVLAKRGVNIITGDKLDGQARPYDDIFADGGEAMTVSKRRIAYDLILWCTGGRPNTAYMQTYFAGVLYSAGCIIVSPDLRVLGQNALFALGDITDLAENKMALHIFGQVKVAHANVCALLTNENARKRMTTYRPQTGNPMMAITLGSRTGVAHLPFFGVVRWPWLNRKAKAEQMLVPRFRKAFEL